MCHLSTTPSCPTWVPFQVRDGPCLTAGSLSQVPSEHGALYPAHHRSAWGQREPFSSHTGADPFSAGASPGRTLKNANSSRSHSDGEPPPPHTTSDPVSSATVSASLRLPLTQACWLLVHSDTSHCCPGYLEHVPPVSDVTPTLLTFAGRA